VTHWMPASEAFRCSWMAGLATATIVPSSATIITPSATASRGDGAAAFAAALAARPAEEEPLTAARHALQSSILELNDGAGRLTAYLAALRLIDSTPSLLAAYLRSVHDHDDEIIEVLARREGIDPVADRRPRVLAAVIGAMVFLANKDWQASDTESPEDLAAAFDAYADAVIPALAGHWT
jgi:MftR C-terminal domain